MATRYDRGELVILTVWDPKTKQDVERPGVVLGYTKTDDGPDRVDVKLDDGPRYQHCHQDHVKRRR